MCGAAKITVDEVEELVPAAAAGSQPNSRPPPQNPPPLPVIFIQRIFKVKITRKELSSLTYVKAKLIRKFANIDDKKLIVKKTFDFPWK